MEDYFSEMSSLNARLYRGTGMLKGVFDNDDFFEHDLLIDEIMGACSFLLKGKVPTGAVSRLMNLSLGMTYLTTVYDNAEPKWSVHGCNAFIEIMMHAWVMQRLRGTDHSIHTIPQEVAKFECTELRLVSYMLKSLEADQSASMSSEAEKTLITCRNVALRVLADDVTTAEVKEAQSMFEQLPPFSPLWTKGPESLWTSDPPDVALRGYLAAIGFCLSWAEIRGLVL